VFLVSGEVVVSLFADTNTVVWCAAPASVGCCGWVSSDRGGTRVVEIVVAVNVRNTDALALSNWCIIFLFTVGDDTSPRSGTVRRREVSRCKGLSIIYHRASYIGRLRLDRACRARGLPDNC